jgi:microcystin degradation protein MlrC
LSCSAFRAAFEPIAREVVLVDTGALCSEIYTPELFTKVRRPVWPLDPIRVRAKSDATTFRMCDGVRSRAP